MQEIEETSMPLPDEIVDYLQALDYEAGGLRVLHTHALNAGVPAGRVEEIRQRFLDKYAEYQAAKQEVWGRYGRGRPCPWWVDFQSGRLCMREEAGNDA